MASNTGDPIGKKKTLQKLIFWSMAIVWQGKKTIYHADQSIKMTSDKKEEYIALSRMNYHFLCVSAVHANNWCLHASKNNYIDRKMGKVFRKSIDGLISVRGPLEHHLDYYKGKGRNQKNQGESYNPSENAHYVILDDDNSFVEVSADGNSLKEIALSAQKFVEYAHKLT